MGNEVLLNQTGSAVFNIKCHGRDSAKKPVLDNPVDVRVRLRQVGNTIEGKVECSYITGSHGQRCTASHPNVDKVGDGVNCPYAFGIPYVFDRRPVL